MNKFINSSKNGDDLLFISNLAEGSEGSGDGIDGRCPEPPAGDGSCPTPAPLPAGDLLLLFSIYNTVFPPHISSENKGTSN